MFLERFQDRIYDIAVRPVAAFHMDVRGRVGRPAFLGEALERSRGIAVAQQRAGVAPRSPGGEDRGRCIEPDRDRATVEQVAGLGSTKTPPPVAITRTSSSTSRATSRRSPSRKSSSPNRSKISAAE